MTINENNFNLRNTIRKYPVLFFFFFVHFFNLCLSVSFVFKDLQSALTARSNEVNSVAFNIQMFISEQAQDLAPEQSRQLLRQLQQLQRTFHRASGRAQAWADALAAQREREAEWQRREMEKEVDREKHSTGEREVWKLMIESTVFS